MVKQGVIHSPTVAPRIAGAQHELEQQIMAITLKHQLEKRHNPSYLVEHNILHGTTPWCCQLLTCAEKGAVADTLEKHLQHRPAASDLVSHNILHGTDSLSPSLAEKAAQLEHARKQDQLSHLLQDRPDKAELVSKGIMESTE